MSSSTVAPEVIRIHRPMVDSVRAYVPTAWRGSVRSVASYRERRTWAFGRSVMGAGVAEVLAEHGSRDRPRGTTSAASPTSSKYMNDGLDRIRGRRAGRQHPRLYLPDGPSASGDVLLKGADCWGWATGRAPGRTSSPKARACSPN
jgi:hypothetical protein